MTDIAIVAVLVAFAAIVAVAVLAILLWRSGKRAQVEDPAMGELTRAQAEAAARLEGAIRLLASSQSQLQRSVNERLDSVSHRLGDSLEKTKQSTAENLQKLGERLAVIDRAQKNITDLATQVTSLQGVLANKQSRGAFGQWRMESIVQDGLPKGAYAFQHTLGNKTRPDCCVFLPDKRPLAIDAKFPLEGVTAYREAKSDDERKAAAQRLRADVGKHVADIAEKYLIPGETQEIAFMFVPSESIYAELYDGFDDLVQKAYRSRVVVVSPSLLMLAIQVVQQIQKDARMREAADQNSRRSRAAREGREPARRSRSEAADAFQPIERRYPAGDHFDRQDRGAWRAHPAGRTRRPNGGASRIGQFERAPRASAQTGGRGVAAHAGDARPRDRSSAHPPVHRRHTRGLSATASADRHVSRLFLRPAAGLVGLDAAHLDA